MKNKNVRFVKIGIYGGTGEPYTLMNWYKGQRTSSTRLLERDLVRGKRFYRHIKAEGKESKQTDKIERLLDVSHLKGMKHGKVGSGETGRVFPKETSSLTYLTRLHTLWKSTTNENFKVYGLHRLARDLDLWIAAYKKLAPNSGSMTKGGAGGTIDGTSLKTLKSLRDSIQNGVFSFGTSRRVYIPKPKGGQRPLGIPEFQDRLVQEVIRTLLETVFEPRFSEWSHGFRPGRSQHTCLRQVRRDFKGTKWYIEGDVSKCFDEINHEKLLHIISNKIKDRQFINLIEAGLKTKTLFPDGKIEKGLVGTPQGGIASPLLSNIALNELDQFIARLKKIVDRGKSRSKSCEYVKWYNLRRKLLRIGNRRESYKALKEARKVGYGDPFDPKFRKIMYTRYADDFLIGVIGPYELAVKIKHLVSRFLAVRLKLRLNMDKTVITRARTSKIPFLGFLIKHRPQKGFKTRRMIGGRLQNIRQSRYGDIHLYADTQKVYNKLKEKGFCDAKGIAKPNFRYLQDPQSFTISRIASILHGLNNYYKIADNRRRSIRQMAHILRQSAAKLFAAKYKLKTQRQVYLIAGKRLGKPLLSSKRKSS